MSRLTRLMRSFEEHSEALEESLEPVVEPPVEGAEDPHAEAPELPEAIEETVDAMVAEDETLAVTEELLDESESNVDALEVEQVESELEDQEEAVATLEAYHGLLTQAGPDGISAQSAAFLNVGLANAYRKLGLEDLSTGLEEFRTCTTRDGLVSVKVSVESISDKIKAAGKKVWETIIKWFKKLSEFFKGRKEAHKKTADATRNAKEKMAEARRKNKSTTNQNIKRDIKAISENIDDSNAIEKLGHGRLSRYLKDLYETYRQIHTCLDNNLQIKDISKIDEYHLMSDIYTPYVKSMAVNIDLDNAVETSRKLKDVAKSYFAKFPKEVVCHDGFVAKIKDKSVFEAAIESKAFGNSSVNNNHFYDFEQADKSNQSMDFKTFSKSFVPGDWNKGQAFLSEVAKIHDKLDETYDELFKTYFKIPKLLDAQLKDQEAGVQTYHDPEVRDALANIGSLVNTDTFDNFDKRMRRLTGLLVRFYLVEEIINTL